MLTDFLSLTEIAFIVVIVIPALMGLVNLLKRLGLAVDFAGPVAIVLGILVMVAYVAWGDNRYFIMGLIGLLIGLGVTGYYDLSKQFGTPSIPPAQIQVDDSWLVADPEPTERTVDLDKPIGARTFDEWDSLRNRKDL